jgi:heme/copper-type cytochrome/quinol oxidase subunit 3
MMIAGLVLTMLLGIATLYLQIKGYTDLSFDANKNAYTSLFYVINIFHSVHLFVALMIVAFVLVQGMMKRFTPARLLAVDNAGWFWYFNVAAWLFVYLIVYLSPHMGSGG